MGKLKGKVAIVTGAGTRGPLPGNGKASAILYGAEGAKVVAADIDLSLAEDTRDQIVAAGGDCIAVKADVALSTDCRALVHECVDHYGRVDVLLNNVGITASGGPVDFAEEDWDRMMAVNVKSMFLMAKYALPHMEAGGYGSIINIGSINGIRAFPFPKLAYAASKGAVIALTREIAIQYAAKGIRCNTVLPGLIRAPIVEQNNVQLYGAEVEEMWRKRDAMSPTGKQGTPVDIAHASLFLASDDSRYINGVVLPVDGGLVNMVKF